MRTFTYRSTFLYVVYIYYTTVAGKSISSQLGSSCQGNRYGTEKAGGMAHPSRTKSHLPGHSPPASQAGRRVGQALWPSASLFIREEFCLYTLVYFTVQQIKYKYSTIAVIVQDTLL